MAGKARPPLAAPTFSNDPSPEALAYFRNKTSTPSFDWRDVWAQEHANAFTVAKATQSEILETLRTAVDDALSNGVPYDQFAKNLTPTLQKLGWWGREAVIDPVTGEEVLAELGSPRRLRLIYDANIRSAHAAGQWERAQRTKFALPFFLYIETTSNKPRDEHLAQVGTIAEIDDPYWDTWFPPNGWNCKCSVRQIGDAEAANLGWRPGTKPPAVPTKPWLNKRTGEIEEIPIGIDPGWQKNPAKFRQQILGELLGGTLDNADTALRGAALKDLGDSWMFRKIAAGGITGNVAAPIGHAGRELAALHGAKSGVVWFTPDAASIARQLGQTADDLALIPRLIDEGAVVRHDTTAGWMTFYRKIDGQYYRAEVYQRAVTFDGEAIKGGGRLNLESFERVNAKSVKIDLDIAKSDGRLVRIEAGPKVNIFDLKPASLGAAAVPRKSLRLEEGKRSSLPDAKNAPLDGFQALSNEDWSAQIGKYRTLSSLAQTHLKTYTSYAYRQINTYLRTGAVKEIVGNDLVAVANPEKAERVRRAIVAVSRAAQEAIYDNVLPQGAILYRGQSLGTVGDQLLKEGYEWRDTGFTSTTHDLKQALPFFDEAKDRGRDAVVMMIDAGGKRGLAVESIAEFEYEREVILPAGSAFRVSKVERNVKRSLLDKPRTYVHVEVIEQPRDLPDNPGLLLREGKKEDAPFGLPKQGKGARKSRLLPVALADAKETVVNAGKATGHEWAYAHDGSGRHIATWTSGMARAVELDRDLTPELWSPKARITLHHNHPSSSSFSDADMRIFERLDGLSEMYVHGHDGSLYRATVQARNLIGAAVDVAGISTEKVLRQAVQDGLLSMADADAVLYHLKALTLQRLGVIRYEYKLGNQSGAVWARHEALLERLAEAIFDGI